MWYFAYGSNMNTRQIEDRVKRAALQWVTGRLNGYVLRFNKRSSKDHSGKANIVPRRDGVVWGIVFELNEDEVEQLAAFEGGYKQIMLEVSIPVQKREVKAATFFADANKPDRPPTSNYLKRILDGAREHELPEDYCKKLTEIKTKD